MVKLREALKRYRNHTTDQVIQRRFYEARHAAARRRAEEAADRYWLNEARQYAARVIQKRWRIANRNWSYTKAKNLSNRFWGFYNGLKPGNIKYDARYK